MSEFLSFSPGAGTGKGTLFSELTLLSNEFLKDCMRTRFKAVCKGIKGSVKNNNDL